MGNVSPKVRGCCKLDEDLKKCQSEPPDMPNEPLQGASADGSVKQFQQVMHDYNQMLQDVVELGTNHPHFQFYDLNCKAATDVLYIWKELTLDAHKAIKDNPNASKDDKLNFYAEVTRKRVKLTESIRHIFSMHRALKGASVHYSRVLSTIPKPQEFAQYQRDVAVMPTPDNTEYLKAMAEHERVRMQLLNMNSYVDNLGQEIWIHRSQQEELERIKQQVKEEAQQLSQDNLDTENDFVEPDSCEESPRENDPEPDPDVMAEIERQFYLLNLWQEEYIED
ncbi:MAG: hypothetical protein KVP17_002750 [Porospora cf. gigantea B]|uniref:uncharacterized protein n=1 Tax=Porospora cf. gigantea B TaxID=2853592 RepID=UPI003571E6C0|nr:MAG: hypothetical protein KVP17_002750 [Porospora cf. gigantea B]